ncbi:28S ribosomal protein S7, mitochondrial [Harpegnathos saltator]|uniref:28S ribosomal protein S7, mitochondrial n=1 Tax=Harpegnathos saltator TaxID=610380 RepID=E2C3D8_HARSA|nr:28S ribosomal protein S7, mitochondrial [Harpegnathos saltator]EFN77476.1 28S ribosomal protein S7, mitochondrial [Harpegnathos saltator]
MFRFSCNFAIFRREYSVFPKHYIQPTFRKDEQEELLQSEDGKKIGHELVKPALATDTCSDFYDPKVMKFTNVIMRNGNKLLAKKLVTYAFENVKRIQLQRYHKATDEEEKEKIELDPVRVFHHALANCTPVLYLKATKKGGITYQVPVPIESSKAQHTAMKWLIEATNDKGHEERFYDTLARVLVATAQNQGGAVRRKHELYKKCQEHRAYAHFRWM